jgi:acetyl esterase/lipase
MVVTQHLINKNSTVIPKLQVLVYPWLQMFSFVTHSSIHYHDKGIITHLSVGKIILSYLGYKNENLTSEREQVINSNDYSLLLDEQNRKRFYSYLDPNLIPEKYKQNREYYNDKRHTEYFSTRPAKLDDSNILVKDENFANDVKKLFSPNISPCLVDDDYLKKLPNTYSIICEWDTLKDDNIMFAERLRKAGVKSEIAYYDTCYHAMVPVLDYDLSKKILDDLLKYISENI